MNVKLDSVGMEGLSLIVLRRFSKADKILGSENALEYSEFPGDEKVSVADGDAWGNGEIDEDGIGLAIDAPLSQINFLPDLMQVYFFPW